MAILTRPANVQKGTPTIFTIDRVELAALPQITDPYYKDINNWKEIFVNFKHSESHQKATCVFVEGSNDAEFKSTHSARGGAWEVQTITIRDYDKGLYMLRRDAIDGAQAEYRTPATGENFQNGMWHVRQGSVNEWAWGGGLVSTDLGDNGGESVTIGSRTYYRGSHQGGEYYGIYYIDRAPAVTLAATDFNMTSGATHGDLYVKNGETVQIASGADKQYGDLVIEAGGKLEILPGGGITTIDVTENCVINGTIDANNGEHNGGTWNKNIFGEDFVLNLVQSAGGSGGQGYSVFSSQYQRDPSSGEYYDGNNYAFWITTTSSNRSEIRFNFLATPWYTSYSATTYVNGDGWVYRRGSLRSDEGSVKRYGVWRDRTVSITTPGPLGGTAVYGNGGGGGKTHSTTPQAGEDGQTLKGGNGGGGTAGGMVYGNDGENGVSSVSAGAGGARGAHGQAVVLRAYKIQGGGTIDASGNKGGNGGDGTGGGSGHPAGGGGAGGSGGSIWLRHQVGTPNLVLNVAAGERGTAGWEDTHITNGAQHGQPGAAGTTDIQTF